ncbi:outer membrane beta-barrel protein [Catenovulum sediminis]|uniref:outer membrane beta-barrel protein n=1 Tax=Catenovulum sediminis TaxID=1740262 RepID=UPI00117DCA08|nr:outer membrane beta-barrel protein [Catenovulum sediminis]
MLKKSVLAIALASASFSSFANWVGGVSYINLSDDDGQMELSLSGIVASLGYKIESDSNFFIMPELRIGTGIGDDTVRFFGGDFKVEMNSFTALTVRGQYDLENGAYLFAAPSYANLDVKVSGYGESASEDEWEFGIGGGIGFDVNESTSAEFSYEHYDGTDALSVGIKVDF